MSFCAGPRMRRSLGSEVSRREAPKLIQGICVLTEVLESCCKMECKGEEKNDGNCFSLPFIIVWLWLKSQESLLTILGPLGDGGWGGGWDHTALTTLVNNGDKTVFLKDLLISIPEEAKNLFPAFTWTLAGCYTWTSYKWRSLFPLLFAWGTDSTRRLSSLKV